MVPAWAGVNTRTEQHNKMLPAIVLSALFARDVCRKTSSTSSGVSSASIVACKVNQPPQP